MARRTEGRVVVFQIRTSLMGARPPIWRCIHVRSDITLAKLHRVLQVAMGWTDSHLHQFVIGEQRYGLPDEDEAIPRKMQNERKHKLGDGLLGPGSRFRYDYDFGDNWQHELAVEEILPLERGRHYPVCLAGARACPPEDVDGLPGYENFLEAVQDPAHPEHEELLDWVGGRFDPEGFNLDEVNRRLGHMK